MSPAERSYREGLAQLARRDFAAAAASLVESAHLAPGLPAAWLALGIARRELGQTDAALEALSRALTLDPGTPQANGQMGLVLQSRGRLVEAIDRFAEEARRFPQVPRNHNNLGMALVAAGRDGEGQEAFVRAVSIDREYVQAHVNLGALFQRRGDLVAAEAAWRQVIRLAPEDAAAHAHLGHLLTTTWRSVDAEPVLRRAMALAPDNPAPSRTLAYVLLRLNRGDEARAIARTVLARRPDDLQASILVALALPMVYESAEALAKARDGYAHGLDALVAKAGRFAADPAQVLGLAWENFNLAYQGGDDRVLQERYADFIAGLGRLASPRHYEQKARRSLAPGVRLRVGFLSSFFRDCTVGKYFASWISGLDRARFEVFAYYTGHVDDTISEALAAAAEHHRHILGAATVVADAVLSDRIDVLVYPDVGMNTASYLLAGMRLAPVQCAAWGHPVTSGQAAIDYFITCDEMEPPGAENHYRERLVRLPGIGTRYARPAPVSAASRTALGLPEAGHLYLCPQSLFKIHPDNDALFARLLAVDEDGRIVFFRDHDEPLTEAYRRRLFAALSLANIDGGERTVFLGRLAHADYMRVNATCDVMLDTLHWSGGNTTLDAIAAGLPIVTLPGRFMRGRQSFAMLRRLGLEDLVATDESDFVRIAVQLAKDARWNDRVRKRMSDGAASIFDDPAPLAALQEFLAGLAVPSGA